MGGSMIGFKGSQGLCAHWAAAGQNSYSYRVSAAQIAPKLQVLRE